MKKLFFILFCGMMCAATISAQTGEYFVSENVEALDEIVGKLKIEN